MASKLVFKNCNISFLNIQNDSPVDLSSEGTDNTINKITLSPVGDNLDKNLIVFNGDFSGSNSINVTSSSTIQSNPTFISTTPVILEPQSTDTIVLIGDFSLSSGINVSSPAKIVSGTAVQLENLKLIIAYENPSEDKLNMVGDFSGCKVFIESPSKINLDGTLGETVVQASVSDVSMNLTPESYVSDITANSEIVLTGDKATIDALPDHIKTQLNVKILYNTFILNTVNGEGTIQFSLPSTGKYKISCFVVDDVNDIPIGQPVTIEIK